MTNDFLTIMQTVLTQGFRLFTAFNLPGVNFSPAILLFGILSFGVAISFIHGILTITATGLKGRDAQGERWAARKESTKG